MHDEIGKVLQRLHVATKADVVVPASALNPIDSVRLRHPSRNLLNDGFELSIAGPIFGLRGVKPLLEDIPNPPVLLALHQGHLTPFTSTIQGLAIARSVEVAESWVGGNFMGWRHLGAAESATGSRTPWLWCMRGHGRRCLSGSSP